MSAPAMTGDPRAGGVPTPALHELSARNLARLTNGYLALIATLADESRGDNQLRAFVLARIGEVDALIVERQDGKAVAA